ncbi:hypothetical protein QFZ66_000993 [Streptomyces sp. B4I13]|uniref:Uncharacterized protein n=1 Tax=Streptomyces achromogenes TaxID=67255 RepID=A0ABU0QB86_STRAH|nr:hypothetical protein [Streptomyces achromogenes]MDQ0835128.1 hypothetical protein [Streptomyces achromogenes]MDQ0957115.1 hypothetical protein [Streptomyces sp. B4I13]
MRIRRGPATVNPALTGRASQELPPSDTARGADTPRKADAP